MLSLYIHIPFCVKKCLYCGFYSTPYSIKGAEQYISSLQIEAAGYKHDFLNALFSTVYMGGGTPSALEPEQLDRVIGIIKDQFRIAGDAEFTMESNPNSITSEKLGLLLERGVNRLSLGIQSLSDEILVTLGRLHTAKQATEAFSLARRSGFNNIGVDLIYGIPGQTMTQWEESLDAVIGLKPEHLSLYSLSLDEGSQFHRMAEAHRFTLPDDEIVAQMYERAVMKLRKAGFDQYELSNFSLPGFECRHNMNYWERGEYLGLGPGAWSFISGIRYANIADSAAYSKVLSCGQKAVHSQEVVATATAAREAVLLGIRTMKGLDIDRFERDFGKDLRSRLERNISRLEDSGLLLLRDGRLKLTDQGMLLSDEVLVRLSL
jgi:oxygen-independent coproporphyrinogen-3 oxidase